MDRQTVFPGQIPLETDLLNTNKNVMIALGKLAAAIFGTSNYINGLAVVPNSPAALNVVVQPGELYSLQNIDGSAYSSLAADTTHQIVKQAISLDQVILSTPSPATVGQSINYLIQASFSEVDDTPIVLPYYNASNPSQAYSGPNNTGASSNTRRACKITLSAKAGIAATTGSQTTPAPDAGYVGLYSVTVANGQTTVTAPNIAQLATAPYLGNAALLNAANAFTQTPTFPTPAPGDNSTKGATTAFIAAAIGALVPAGQVSHFAMNTAPTGWLKANGALVSRTTFANLFAAIGTTFGVGDGSTTFKLPDLRGEFLRGWDDSRGVDTGRVFGSAQSDALQNITGSVTNVTFGGGGVPATSGAITTSGSATAAALGSAYQVQSLSFDASLSPGARTASETRSRNIALLACIKY